MSKERPCRDYPVVVRATRDDEPDLDPKWLRGCFTVVLNHVVTVELLAGLPADPHRWWDDIPTAGDPTSGREARAMRLLGADVVLRARAATTGHVWRYGPANGGHGAVVFDLHELAIGSIRRELAALAPTPGGLHGPPVSTLLHVPAIKFIDDVVVPALPEDRRRWLRDPE